MYDAASKAIGGYFELELPRPRHRTHRHARMFQSGRAAFHAVLSAGRPDRVWMPRYICDAMLSPLAATGTEVVFYSLDQHLGVDESVALMPGDWLLYVNYFGVCGEQRNKLLQRFRADQLVMDHSQAFFEPPGDCLAAIYSPRKFFGLPDGGLLHTTLDVREPQETDSGSAARCAHLLKRLDGSAQAGRADFQAAERSLHDTHPRRMSVLSRRLLESVDGYRVKRRRTENFLFLHEALGGRNGLDLDGARIDGPLCYPLLSERPGMRERLIAEGVYVAQYWPEAAARVEAQSLERKLVDGCLAIPCDQRYSLPDLERVIEIVTDGGE